MSEDQNLRSNAAQCGRMEEIALKSKRGGSRPGAGRKPKPQPIPRHIDFPYWCVVQSHPMSERLATHEISRAGFRAYLPLTATLTKSRSSAEIVRAVSPLFRGYLFVELTTPHWADLRYQPGVRNVLLGHNGNPWRVNSGLIDRLMSEDEVRLQLENNKLPSFKHGQKVTVTSGAMAQNSGSVVSCDGLRTVVSIELFGRNVPVQIARDALVAVD